MVLMVDRVRQNRRGAQIGDFASYFDELIKRAGYINAADIVRLRFNISVYIK